MTHCLLPPLLVRKTPPPMPPPLPAPTPIWAWERPLMGPPTTPPICPPGTPLTILVTAGAADAAPASSIVASCVCGVIMAFSGIGTTGRRV